MSHLPLTAKAHRDDFTIAVLPDSQNYLDYSHQKNAGFPFDASEMYFELMRYLAEHTTEQGRGIAFVTAVGDIWEHQALFIDPEHEALGFRAIQNPILDSWGLAPTPKAISVEMPLARKAFEIISGKVPFSVVPGNHDHDAMWSDARFPPAERFEMQDWRTAGALHPGGLTGFRSVFGDESPLFKGKPWYVASHDGGADSAQIFDAGGARFLNIGLQFDPPDASLEWAASVVRRYPRMPTVVTTHDFLNKHGQRLPYSIVDGYAIHPELHNAPEMVWQKLISQHDQIFLVLCGHQAGQSRRIDDNNFGHKVYQMLANYQFRGQTGIEVDVEQVGPFGTGIGDGWIRLLQFDLQAEVPVIHVRTYSTHYRRFSVDVPEYANWYKAKEMPAASDAEFLAADDFVLELTDFRARFGAGAETA